MAIGLLLIGLAAMSWGTTGATMAVLGHETAIGPLAVGWARLAVAAPCLVLAAAAVEVVRRRRPLPPPAPRLPSLAGGALLGLAMAAYQVCYFRAVTLTGVSVAALLAICSAPIMIALLATLWLGERLSPIVLVSLAMAVGGTGLLVVGPRGLGEISGRFGAGVALALGAGLSYAVYAVATKRVLARAAPLAVAAVTFSLGALFLSPALLIEPPAGVDLERAAPLLLYLGLGPTAAAYGLYTAGLRRVPATAAGIASLVEPLTASVLGVAVFHEEMGSLGFAGAALLVGALALLAVARPPTG